MPQDSAEILLPAQLISPSDLVRLLRELNSLDDSLRQMKLRRPGETTRLARTSRMLEDVAELNNMSLTDETDRLHLQQLLSGLQKHAPQAHIAFATEPSGRFLENLIGWMRKNIHPSLLLDVGVQPTIAIGCTLRTPNKYFDMSLRHHFDVKKPLLTEALKEVDKNGQ